MTRSFVVGVVGAESTGKTLLCLSLREALAIDGLRVAVVSETLREFCDAHGRTPTPGEQAGIAAEQTRRIETATPAHDIVIADTTALMTAVYSEMVFGDRSLYGSALADHSRCDLTLLTALDLPWVADGLQRDGAHVREPVDALLRAALLQAGLSYSVIAGLGDARAASALAAVQAARRARDNPPPTGPRWTWVCEDCDDGACERHLFPRAESA